MVEEEEERRRRQKGELTDIQPYPYGSSHMRFTFNLTYAMNMKTHGARLLDEDARCQVLLEHLCG